MHTTVIDFFEKTVEQYSDKVAVVEEEKTITFGKLKSKSTALASVILQYTNSTNCPIAVYLPKGIDSVVADIGICYSGNVFMNLDIKTPYERIHNILNLTKPALIISTYDILKKLNINDMKQIYIEDICEMDNQTEIVMNNRIDTDPFCIINTSGSTGTPKAVVLNHRSFFDFLTWSIEKFDLDSTITMGCLSPIVFDIYVFEMCLMMFKGAKMVLLSNLLGMFPAKMLTKLVEEKVNFIFWVPSIMVNISNCDLLDKCDLQQLKEVWFAGEVFPTKQFNYWKKHLPNTRFTNLYGPIEITLDCTYYIIDREFEDCEIIPIGYPCKNTDILILNEENELCKENENGELCVRGTSLAMGYYNNPPKTQEAFVQNPLNRQYPELLYRTGDIVYRNGLGEIIFCGRKDSLIKHMGYRIELGEIEHILTNELNLVDYCCVCYDKNEKKIILFYEAEKDVDTKTMRNELLSKLPKYMIPSVFIRKEELPRNNNGKIDRFLLEQSLHL